MAVWCVLSSEGQHRPSCGRKAPDAPQLWLGVRRLGERRVGSGHLETLGCMWALLILPRLVACPLSPCMCECGSDLQVHTNAITGIIPTWLSVLTQLEYVHRSSCVVSEPARCVLVSIVMCKHWVCDDVLCVSRTCPQGCPHGNQSAERQRARFAVHTESAAVRQRVLLTTVLHDCDVNELCCAVQPVLCCAVLCCAVLCCIVL